MCLEYRPVLGVDRHLMPPHTAGWETRPTGMESQHTGSFPRVCSERSANSRAPGPSPRFGLSPRLAWRLGLLSQPVAGALSSRLAVFLPRPLLSPSLLCSIGSFTALKVEAGRLGGARRPLFSGGAPAFKAAAAFPRPAQVLRARFPRLALTTTPARRDEAGRGPGVPPCPSALSGRWVPRAPGTAAAPAEAATPTSRPGGPRGSAAQSPRRRGGRGSLRAVPAVPNGRPRPDIKAAAAALLSLRRPGPPEPPLPAAAATMGRPPPPLRRVLVFLSILLPSLLPLAGSAAGAGTRRTREPGPRGAGRWGEESLPHSEGLRWAPAPSGKLANPPAMGGGGNPLPLKMSPISRWCVLDACGILVILTAWGPLRPEGPCTAA